MPPAITPNRELYPQDSKSNWAWQLGLGAVPKAVACQTVSAGKWKQSVIHFHHVETW
jgi:hypothetical protein